MLRLELVLEFVIVCSDLGKGGRKVSNGQRNGV